MHQGLLRSPLPLTEGRAIRELTQRERATTSELGAELDLDAGRKITLWTNDLLVAARHIYRRPASARCARSRAAASDVTSPASSGS